MGNNIVITNSAFERSVVLRFADGYGDSYDEAYHAFLRIMPDALLDALRHESGFERGWAMFYDGTPMASCANLSELYGLLSAGHHEDESAENDAFLATRILSFQY